MYDEIVENIVLRIESANPSSMIAVFKKPGKKLHACFDNTVQTKRSVKAKDKGHIGSFHRYMNISKIEKQLKKAIS